MSHQYTRVRSTYLHKQLSVIGLSRLGKQRIVTKGYVLIINKYSFLIGQTVSNGQCRVVTYWKRPNNRCWLVSCFDK